MPATIYLTCCEGWVLVEKGRKNKPKPDPLLVKVRQVMGHRRRAVGRRGLVGYCRSALMLWFLYAVEAGEWLKGNET